MEKYDEYVAAKCAVELVKIYLHSPNIYTRETVTDVYNYFFNIVMKSISYEEEDITEDI